VALGDDGVVWVLDQGRARVVGRAPDGTLTSLGSLGDGPAQLNDPTGLAVGGGLVYVADPHNRRIQVFTVGGDFVRSLALAEWGTPFDYPDVAVDVERGLLYASHPSGGEVLVFDLDGERLATLSGTAGDELRAPSALAVAPDGRLLVVDYGASRVVALEPPAGSQ
jgi:DNA-binding beta-propeller fold protein YncE